MRTGGTFTAEPEYSAPSVTRAGGRPTGSLRTRPLAAARAVPGGEQGLTARTEVRRIRPVTTSVNSSVGADFGPNEWLVHEIWQQYREDPESVSPEWREFLSDYRPA